MLTFWGLSTKSIDAALIKAPFIYVGISILCIIISFFLAKIFFTESKERSIVAISSAIGNTGNLGIPIGIAIFGQESIIFTSLINVANVFIVYTIGIYFYSRGQFSIKESLLNIVKLPLTWFALFTLIFNLLHVEIHNSILNAVEMGAYAAMVLQFMIFGMFLYSAKLRNLNLKLIFHVGIIKFIIIPIISIMVLKALSLDEFIFGIILLELLVPLAVTNVNLSSLYNCNLTFAPKSK